MRKLLLLICFAFSFMPSVSFAQCNSSFINPITDISWRCIFPMRIGGVISLGSGEEIQAVMTIRFACVKQG